MIANITQGNYLKPLLEYNDEKVKNKEATLLTVANSIDDNKDIAEQLILSLASKSKRKDTIFHVSINFPKEDTALINDNILKDIAKDYLTTLGFNEEHPYLVYKHDDKDHPHIHIVTSKILDTGKVLNDSNLFRRSQSITRSLEKDYNLAQISSEKRQNITPEHIEKTNFNSLREKLNYHIRQALQVKKVSTFKELKDYLLIHELSVSKISGIKDLDQKPKSYEGIVFSDLQENFKQKQKGIKASSLYLKPTSKNLDKVFKTNIASHRFRRKQIRNTIEYMFNYYQQINYDSFKNKLNNKGVDVNYKFDSKNKLVGISFTDKVTNKKFTGENIGKQFTAKNISPYLTIDKNLIKPNKQTETSLKPLLASLKPLAVNQQLQFLISLGFRVKERDQTIYVSDYKNDIGTGFIPYIKSSNAISFVALNNYLSLKGIDYEGYKSKLYFEYNRAKLSGNTSKQAEIIELYNKLYSKTNDLDGLNNSIDDKFDDVFTYVKPDNSDDGDGVSDADRKKKKRRGRKR